MQGLYHSQHDVSFQGSHHTNSIVVRVPSAHNYKQDNGQQQPRDNPPRTQHRSVFSNSNRCHHIHDQDGMNSQSADSRVKFLHAVDKEQSPQQRLQSRSYVKHTTSNRQHYDRRPSQVLADSHHQERRASEILTEQQSQGNDHYAILHEVQDDEYANSQRPNSGILYKIKMLDAPNYIKEHRNQMKGIQNNRPPGCGRPRSDVGLSENALYTPRVSARRRSSAFSTDGADMTRRGSATEMLNRNNELVYKQCERRPSVMGGVMTLTDVNKYIYGHANNKKQPGRPGSTNKSNEDEGDRPKSGFKPGRRKSGVDGRHINIQVAREFVNSNRRSSACSQRIHTDDHRNNASRRASVLNLTDVEEINSRIHTGVDDLRCANNKGQEDQQRQPLPKPQFSTDNPKRPTSRNEFPGRRTKRNRKQRRRDSVKQDNRRGSKSDDNDNHNVSQSTGTNNNTHDQTRFTPPEYQRRRSETPPVFDLPEQEPMAARFDDSVNLNAIPEIVVENQNYAPIINNIDDKHWNSRKNCKRHRRNSNFNYEDDRLDGTISRPNSGETQRRTSTHSSIKTYQHTKVYNNTNRRRSQVRFDFNEGVKEPMSLRSRASSSMEINTDRPLSAITRRNSNTNRRRSSSEYQHFDTAPPRSRRGSHTEKSTASKYNMYNSDDATSRSNSRCGSSLAKDSVVYLPISVKTFNASEVLADVPTLVFSQNRPTLSQNNQTPQHQLQRGTYLTRRRPSGQDNRIDIQQLPSRRSSLISLAGFYINDTLEHEEYRPSSSSRNRRRSSILGHVPIDTSSPAPRTDYRASQPEQSSAHLDKLRFIDLSKQSASKGRRAATPQPERPSAPSRRPASAVTINSKQTGTNSKNRRNSYAGDHTLHIAPGQKVEVITGMVPRIVVTSEPKRKQKKPYELSITLQQHDADKPADYLRVPGWSDSEDEEDDLDEEQDCGGEGMSAEN